MKLRQKKGLINKECLLLSIEDPGAPIGSGGATLNALQIVAETLSAKKKCKVCYFIFLYKTWYENQSLKGDIFLSLNLIYFKSLLKKLNRLRKWNY